MKTLEEIKQLNRHSVDITPGVYFLFNDNDLVYVGESEDIHRRVGQHRKNKEYDSYSFIVQTDPHLRLRLEKAYIEKFNPKYNKRAGNSSNKRITHAYKSNEQLIRNLYRLMKKNGYKRSFVYFQYLQKASYYCINDLRLLSKKLGYKRSWIQFKVDELQNNPKWWNYTKTGKPQDEKEY